MELWYRNLQTGFHLSGAPEPPSVIQIIWILPISGAPDPRIAKEVVTFTESTMLNNSKSIAQENHYQHLDYPETDPAQYISNHPGIETLSTQYRVNVPYSKTQLAYSGLTRRIQTSLSSLRNEVQAHLWSTLLSSVMVSDLTPHAYSKANVDKQAIIFHICFHSRHTSEPCIPTLHYLWICGCQHTECHLSDTKLLAAGAAHPTWPQLISESTLDEYVKAAA